MRKKLACLLLAGALALSLSACAPGGEIPGPAETPSQPVETAPVSQEPSEPPSETPSLSPEPPAPPLSADYDLPDRDYQPWQTAYMNFLAELCRIDVGCPWDYAVDDVDGLYKGLAVDERGVYAQTGMGKQLLTDVMGMGIGRYSLYDVDRDGVPELFVAYGFGEHITQCYTYRDGETVCIGEFVTKDSGLYTHPEKNAVLCHGGRMGYYELYEYPMEGGRLTEGRVIFSEGPVDFGTETEEIVPGAERIDYFYPWLGEADDDKFHTPEYEGTDDGRPHPSVGKALLLPICDWYDGPAATGDDSAQGRSAILAALNGDTELYGASGDHFHGDVGPTAWEEYIQPKGALPYNEEPLEIRAHTWLDLNGDGQDECVLQLGQPERAEDASTRSQYAVVLSEQEGTVYAYFFGLYEMEFYADGTTLDFLDSPVRLSFWKGQCYQYAVPATSAPAVKWLDGSPVG